jgi:hypothetical protein
VDSARTETIGRPAIDGDELPPSVQRYLERAVPADARRATRARISQEGSFLVRPPSGWRPFRATQVLTVRPPGFVWQARIRVLPGLHIAVRDAFEDGAGSMRARLLGFPLADTAGTLAIAAAALQRYLAEAVLLPTALLPSQGVTWKPIDASTARACLAAGTTRVSLQFRFGPDGLVESVFAPARLRDVDGRGVPTPWSGRWWDYQEQDGLLAPRRGEVEWLLPQGPQPYWRGQVTRVAYELD